MPCKTINLITGNPRKIARLQEAVTPYGYKVEVTPLDCPEIQANSTAEIAAFAARWAANKTGRACVKMDSGFFVKEFGAFPGPYVRWVDEGMGAERFFKIAREAVDQEAEITYSIAYCEPDQEPVTFFGSALGTLPKTLGPVGSFIDRLFVSADHNPQQLTLGELRETDPEAVAEIWGQAEREFITWLITNSQSEMHSDLPQGIGKPARRALASNGIHTLKEVSTLTEKELLQLHGMGPKAVRILKEALAEQQLRLKSE